MTVYSVDKEAVSQALEHFVAALSRREEVLAVVLFGSYHRGGFGVGSDVDVMVILTEADRPFLERIPEYMPDQFPIDLDVFPYTLEEVRSGHPLCQEALCTGRVVWAREGFAPPIPDLEVDSGI